MSNNVPLRQPGFEEKEENGFVNISRTKQASKDYKNEDDSYQNTDNYDPGLNRYSRDEFSDWDDCDIRIGLRDIASGEISADRDSQSFTKRCKSHNNFKGRKNNPAVDCLYIRTQLKILIDRWKCSDELLTKNFFREQNSADCDISSTVFSFIELAETASLELEILESLKEELFSIKKLLDFYKSKNRGLYEKVIELEMNLKDVNEDYGQLLVEYDARKKIPRTPPERSLVKEQQEDKSVQTNQLTWGDEGAPTIPQIDSATQTEPVDFSATANLETISNAGTNACRVEEKSCEEQYSVQSQSSTPSTTARTETMAVVLESKTACDQTVTGRPKSSPAPNNGNHRTFTNTDHSTILPTMLKSPSEYSSNVHDPLSDYRTTNACMTVSEAEGLIPWSCEHYKKRCTVKFVCCEKYYPCHRCHNRDSTCGKKSLKSRDATLLKCSSCNHPQRFDESSQNCSNCGLKFAEYFCHKCQHLTGTDDAPYHCDSCGICRVHGDRSFHCDKCGVCLDLQLLNNHQCREGSAHDPCGICLEDAFFGCQILPCSHKVHKDCATVVIRNGIRNCPVCRQSFAHKLQRIPRQRQEKNTPISAKLERS